MALQARSDMELWDRPFQTLLIGVLLVNILAHAFNVPWWVLVASGVALGWKIGHLYFGWPLPPRKILYLVGAVIGGAVAWEYKTMLGHEAATPILVFLASLKLLETNRDRDAMFIIVTSYFLLMAHLLHSQSLGTTFFMAFDVAIITILMFQLHRADRRVTARSLRPIVRLLIFTIPIWLCLFIVFPRFTLKTFRKSQPIQATGFSESLDPGSVSSLAQSNEIAFRASHISGPRRSPSVLYWRGATLYNGDGMKWKPQSEKEIREGGVSIESLPLAAQPKIETTELEARATRYDIITEPAQGRAIFTLPRVIAFDAKQGLDFLQPFVTADATIRLGTPRRDHVAYAFASIPEEQGDPETLDTRIDQAAQAPPLQTSLRYQRLIDELRKKSRTPHAAMEALDDWFVAGEFRYTLTPGEGNSTSIDDFLFKSKKGFCEHFAAASATMLRSLGYKSRVVVGYQGGKYNSVSQALIVRSRDAHAWVEVWFPLNSKPGYGRWLTYDPTASIAPLRLRLGGEFLDLPEEQQQVRGTDGDQILANISRSFAMRVIDQSLMMWDYAQMSWTQFLLNYDRSGQREFLNQLFSMFGLKSGPWVMTGLILAFLGIVLRLIFLWHSRGPRESVLRREWTHFERELKRLGVVTSISDGPLTIRDRIESETLRDGLDAFIELQYGDGLSKPQDSEKFNDKLSLIRRARREAKRLETPPLVQQTTP